MGIFLAMLQLRHGLARRSPFKLTVDIAKDELMLLEFHTRAPLSDPNAS
ncbi:hypothetical protein WN982_30325 [Paraburkholderia sp. IMGN_8]